MSFKLRKYLFLFVFLTVISLSFSLFAQETWVKTYGGTGNDRGYSLQQTSDGGFIMIGFTSSFDAESDDVFLVKTDSNGNTEWTKVFGGSGSNIGCEVIQVADGGFVLSYYTDNSTEQEVDGYAVKTNSMGEILWTKSLGKILNYKNHGIMETTTGDFLFALSSFPNNSNRIVKTDSSGAFIWEKQYGNELYSIANDFLETNDGNILLTGGQQLINLSGDTNVFLIIIDINGDTLMYNSFGDSLRAETGIAIDKTGDSGYIITGYRNSDFGVSEIIIYKIRSDLTVEWSNTHSTIGGNNLGVHVQSSVDNEFIFAHTGNDQIYFMKTDQYGNEKWIKSFGTTGYYRINDMISTTDGGIAVSGYTSSATAGSYDIFLFKTDSLGVVTSVKEDKEHYPNQYKLHQNYPNPFNPTTSITYSISKSDIVIITIFDVLGREIVTLVNESKSPGVYTAEWDGKNKYGVLVSGGIYFYKLTTGSFTETRKMLLLK